VRNRNASLEAQNHRFSCQKIVYYGDCVRLTSIFAVIHLALGPMLWVRPVKTLREPSSRRQSARCFMANVRLKLRHSRE